eukprot:m.152420 g.152420  ORF g.152420 m.152420 type:complete len:284 (+) comp38588_c0_seq34:1466-2317(+)
MVKGRKKSHIVGEFKAGFSFGEMALLHDAKRRATIVCKTFSEFLRVDKPDFEEVSKKQQQQEWNIRLQCLKTWPEFSTWSDADLAMAADASRTVEFKPNDVIFSKVTHKLDDVYFLIKGECVIAREMTIYSVILPDKTRRLVIPRSKRSTRTTQRCTEQHKGMVRIRILHAGNFFGVGEDLCDAHVIATTKVECLLVSRLAFVKHDYGAGLEKMRAEANEPLPSNKMAYRCLVRGDQWAAYKKKVLNEALCKTRQRKTHTKLQDAPGYLSKRTRTTEMPPVTD